MGEEDRGVKPEGHCDTGEVMDEGSMESPLCEIAKDVNTGNVHCSIRGCLHY